MIARRQPDPANAFRRSALLLCGVALTWTCAAFGLLVAQFELGACRCPSRVKIASLRVREIDNAIAQYQIDQRRCPKRPNDLLVGKYVSARGLVDPWERDIQFTCADNGDTRVASAGPDGIFGTSDDIRNER
jgi:hypothetical protein